MLTRMNLKAPLENIPVLPEAQLSSLPQEIQNYICCLHTAFLSLIDANRRLTEEAADFKARLAKDSTNSHKPPSNEGMRKPKSQRTPSGNPPGGQPGHTGSTLMQVADPHDIQTHVPTHCSLVLCASYGSGWCVYCKTPSVRELPTRVAIACYRAPRRKEALPILWSCITRSIPCTCASSCAVWSQHKVSDRVPTELSVHSPWTYYRGIGSPFWCPYIQRNMRTHRRRTLSPS